MAVVKIEVCDGCGDPAQKDLKLRRLGDEKGLERYKLCPTCRAPIDAIRRPKRSGRSRTPVTTIEELESAARQKRSAARTPAQKRADKTRGTRSTSIDGA